MSLQERLETIRSLPVPQNEESAKLQILAPILQELGWDPFGPEVLYEHPVGGKGGGGRVDIALRSVGRVVALIEAKAPGADLRSHVGQVLGYAFHEGVDICVLTTGLEWWLFLPMESGEPLERRFAVLNVKHDPIGDLVGNFRATLGKAALASGDAAGQARLVLREQLEAAKLSKDIPLVWKRMLTEPDDELIALLSKRVYDETRLRPTDQQIVAVLQGANIPSKPPTLSRSSASTRQQPRANQQTHRPRMQATAVEIWGTRYPVSSGADLLRTVAAVLLSRHPDDFDRILTLRGIKNPLVARDVQHLGTSNQRQPHRCELKDLQGMPTGYYIDVHPKDFQERAERYLRHFGYSASDLELLYE